MLFLAIVPLALCVGVCLLWARSITHYEHLGWATPVLDETGQPTTQPATSANPWTDLFVDDAAPRSHGVVIDCRVYGIECHQGILALGVIEPSIWPERAGWYHISEETDQPMLREWCRHGFAWFWSPADSRWLMMTWRRELMLPCWVAASGLLLLSLAMLLPMRLQARTRRRRATAGHCPACDFDLRASPGRCPECGVKIVAALREPMHAKVNC